MTARTADPSVESEFESPVPSSIEAVYVPHDTEIGGPVQTNGSVWVDGTVRGEIIAEGEVVVTEDAVVEGTIRATSADVGGAVDGAVRAKEKLVLEQTARVRGDIETTHLIVEEGAFFAGDCRMDLSGGDPTEVFESKVNKEERNAPSLLSQALS